MPVVTAGSKSLPPLDRFICEQQWLCSRLAVSILIIMIILALLFLPRQTTKRPRPNRSIGASPAGKDITWASGASLPSIVTNISTASDCWVRLKQGQAHIEKRANRAVSRGGASGTALVGLGGSREGGEMDKEKRASSRPRSRGVSTIDWNDRARVSGGLPSHDQLLATAAQSDHVGTSASEDAAAGPHEEQDRMKDARFRGLVGVSAGSDVGAIREARGHVSTSFLGDHMADDEHILYGIKKLPHTGPAVGRWPPSHHQHLSPPPTSLTPPMSAVDSSSGLTTNRDHSKAITIPSRDTSGSRFARESYGDGWGGKDTVVNRPEEGASPSSYPPTSPLLPPPPPQAHEAFDPSAIMFPGLARDGGIRIVPAHNHSNSVQSHTHGEVASGSDNPRASWTRHTRVYGGGVCLACAAAGGGEGGGFYGDSVRPEDKR